MRKDKKKRVSRRTKSTPKKGNKGKEAVKLKNNTKNFQ
jgi:hypothetical protein